jgi:hypothetical protein
MPIIDTYRPVLVRTANFRAAGRSEMKTMLAGAPLVCRRTPRQSGHEIAEFQTGHFGACDRLGKQNEPLPSFWRN